jgi:hypothetical protein
MDGSDTGALTKEETIKIKEKEGSARRRGTRCGIVTGLALDRMKSAYYQSEVSTWMLS